MAVPPYVTAGTVIEETWGDQIADSVVNPFGNAAARSAAITAPTTGMTSAITSANSSNGLEVYNGVNWYPSWNMPWGYVTTATPGSFNFNSTIAYSSAFAVPMIDNRLYRFSITGYFSNSSVTGVIDTLSLHLNTGSTLVADSLLKVTQTTASGQNGATGTALYTTTTTASVSFKLGALSSASATNQSFVTSSIIVEDIGPSGPPV